jgi:hypothetical protein
MNNRYDFAFWKDFIQKTWCPARHHLIDLILDTGRVRESWLQGDLYLAARTSTEPPLPFFYCNSSVEGYGGPVDWSYWESHQHDARPLMLAEVKVLGGDYDPKVFCGTGFDLRGFLQTKEYIITPEHSALKHSCLGYLLEDYRRLITYAGGGNPVRMLVLVLDTRCRKRLLGQCLDAVQFEGVGVVLIETPKWLCKTWHITRSLS